eukprot:1272879-Rhodomonas_salina.1
MSGTAIAHTAGAVRYPVLSPYAMPGTDLAYLPTLPRQYPVAYHPMPPLRNSTHSVGCAVLS